MGLLKLFIVIVIVIVIVIIIVITGGTGHTVCWRVNDVFNTPQFMD